MVDISPVTGKPFPFEDDAPEMAPPPNGQLHPLPRALSNDEAQEAAIAGSIRAELTTLLRDVCRQINLGADRGLSTEFELSQDESGHMIVGKIRIAREY